MASQHGVDEALAAEYTAKMMAMYAGDCVKAAPNGLAGFQALVDEQTPGGLNEGNIALLRAAGVFQSAAGALTETLAKLG